MKLRKLQTSVALLAVVTWFFPRATFADNTAQPGNKLPPVTVRDITLGPQGRLIGQAMDVQGRELARQSLGVFQAGRQVGVATTDAHGRFVFENLRPGIYQLAGAEQIYVCRCWTPQTAPPASNRELLVVAGQEVQRGQRPMVDLLRDPLIVALIIAAAVAIPIIVHNAKNDKAAGS